MTLSVILPTHNPHAGRLARTLTALRQQTVPPAEWELVLVDNVSSPAVRAEDVQALAPPRMRLVREPQLGLTHARRRGLEAARADCCVFVDDDNVLASDYLAHVVRLFAAHPRIAALGGRSMPEFERPPEPWHREFFDLLALRDLGPEPRIASELRPPGTPRNAFPAFAPIGAGMAVRRRAALEASDDVLRLALSDRRGTELSSGGDNALVFALMTRGWQVAYFPELSLTHLIPASRLEARYLARLNRGIQRSWTQLLTHYQASPWPPIAPWTLPLRAGKAWLHRRAWRSPSAYIRWQGAFGHFEGRIIRSPS